MKDPINAEEERLCDADAHRADWKLWGCYVSERAWGTVREDYSPDGSAWDFFPFEHAHLRTFRWNEDGIAAISDRRQNLCFSPAFWNGADPILKERLFGLAGPKGNHGEDVKECYYYLDNTPTHSYMKFLYKYPQAAFPYESLYEENGRRTKADDEFELIDTGIFDENRYFDIVIEYAKADVADIFIRITAFNRGPETAPLHILPTFWFRNTWLWDDKTTKPQMRTPGGNVIDVVSGDRELLSNYTIRFEDPQELLFCENESNNERLFGTANFGPFPKDGINDYIVSGAHNTISPERTGTKAAGNYRFDIEPGGSRQVLLRLTQNDTAAGSNTAEMKQTADELFDLRKAEADEFYAGITPAHLSSESKMIIRRSLAGMLWSKQFYHYVVRDWLNGDPAFPPPPEQRLTGRNSSWQHLYNDEIVSMPDKWEYPWYAAWDLAFHCIPIALIDPDFAKRQLLLLLREWYMHPNGQIPAYEWAFGDVNPPVHAWAALRVYNIERKRTGKADRKFLERVFHKLLLNFTWWVNRKDDEGNNVFEGGFLGMDNIGIFDRSSELPSGGHLEQSDGTSWMSMYCLNMLAIALELARDDRAYEDVASKFFEHFVYISDAMNNLGNTNTELWNEEDGFYYDVLHIDGHQLPIKLRSLVGLVPLLAVETIEEHWLDDLPNFRRRTEWFLKNRSDLTDAIACMQKPGREGRRMLALVDREKLRRVLTTMLSEDEFLSQFGIRSLSRRHKVIPFEFDIGDEKYWVEYEPGESRSGMFGGNSNWRGPIWFPINYLLIEALQKFDYFYGEAFKIEFPTGSGNELTLWEISQELEKRLCSIFLKDENGKRAVFGDEDKMQRDEFFRDHILFHEYFHGDNGKGLGASHQTGWTGLIAKILKQIGEYSSDEDLVADSDRDIV